MELQKKHIMGVVFAILILIMDIIFLREDKLFYFIVGIAATIAVTPFVFSIMFETRRERENDERFLEFARDLVESVKAGTPISKGILNVRNKDYGTLSPYVKKLANQIALGIPVKDALKTFANDVNSRNVSRSIALIIEAEKAGGLIDKILESVAVSVAESEKLKKERRNAIYGLVVQSYVIFLVFIVIMLIMQFKILALASGVVSVSDLTSVSKSAPPSQEFAGPFTWLLIFQGLFTGLVTGKLAEGSLKAGVKHSFFLVLLAVLISTGATVFFG